MRKIFLFLSLIMLGVVLGCGHNKNDDLKFSGTLELTEHSLGSQTSGRLTTLKVDEGSLVTQGQEIATLDRFEQAQKDYVRVEQLHKQGGASQQDLEHAALARDDQRIMSPVDGIVLVKVHEVGEMVQAGAPVIVVGDRKDLWVRIYVPEGIINNIKMNQAAQFKFDGIKKIFNGHVSFIASKAEFTPRNVQTSEERVTQTFAVKVMLDDAPEFLRPGVAADVTIVP